MFVSDCVTAAAQCWPGEGDPCCGGDFPGVLCLGSPDHTNVDSESFDRCVVSESRACGSVVCVSRSA